MVAASPFDSWDQPLPSAFRHKVPTQPVPDDWENDDDDDDDDDAPVTEENNQRIWEDANAKAPNPMPALIIAPSVSSSNHVIPPPPSAFQPTMRILKRPNTGADKSMTPPPSSLVEGLKEREARYQAARERIFGPDSGTNTPSGEEPQLHTSNSSTSRNFNRRERTKPSTPPGTLIRSPRGPSSSPDPSSGATPPRGFDDLRTKPPKTQTPPKAAEEG